eukprot:TRINITY_DN1855_c0_g1_i3.p1 TRINITY_DN1855_c0_g1~~TRINITY_DN1855_c0_g1_i3.p1  ORF type:complete len:3930 (+),score=866.22 TRINITY_DN1855_c0_g1_i3:1305-13094(+)
MMNSAALDISNLVLTSGYVCLGCKFVGGEPDEASMHKGRMDEVMLFSRAFSSIEVEELEDYGYSHVPSTALMNDAALFAYYGFETCSSDANNDQQNYAPLTAGIGTLSGNGIVFGQHAGPCLEDVVCLTNGPCYQLVHIAMSSPISMYDYEFGAPTGTTGDNYMVAAQPKTKAQSDFIWTLLPSMPESAFYYLDGYDSDDNQWIYQDHTPLASNGVCQLSYCAWMPGTPDLDVAENNFQAALVNMPMDGYWTDQTVPDLYSDSANAHGSVLQWGQNDVTWFGNNHKYTVVFLHGDMKTFADARQLALDAGGYLATFHSLAEFSFVFDVIRHIEDTFMGGAHGNDGWYWVDGPEANQVFYDTSCEQSWCITPQDNTGPGMVYSVGDGETQWASSDSQDVYVVESRNPSSERAFGFGYSEYTLGSLSLMYQFSITELDIPLFTDSNDQGKKMRAHNKNLLLLTTSGELWAIGENSNGQFCSGAPANLNYWYPVSLPAGLTVTDMAISDAGLVMLCSDGNLYTCGTQSSGNLGLLTDQAVSTPTMLDAEVGVTNPGFVSVALGSDAGAAIGADGFVYVWGVTNGLNTGTAQYGYTQLPGVSDAVEVAASTGTFVIRTSTGDVYTYGQYTGRDGDGTLPGKVTKLTTTAKTIFTGSDQVFVIDVSGSVYAWGYNEFGQLGLGDENDRTYPTKTGAEGAVYVTGAAWERATVLIDNIGRWNSVGQNTLIGIGSDNDDDRTSSFTSADRILENSASGDPMAIAFAACGRGFCQVWTHSEALNACPIGHYGTDGVVPCSQCAEGTYSPHEGATTCTSCPAGSWSSTVEGTTIDDCTACGQGYWSDVQGATSADTCYACPVGTYSEASTASSNATCVLCAAGSYAASEAQNGCQQCPRGTYSTIIGGSSADSCLTCPDGTWGWATGATTCEYSVRCSACYAYLPDTGDAGYLMSTDMTMFPSLFGDFTLVMRVGQITDGSDRYLFTLVEDVDNVVGLAVGITSDLYVFLESEDNGRVQSVNQVYVSGEASPVQLSLSYDSASRSWTVYFDGSLMWDTSVEFDMSQFDCSSGRLFIGATKNLDNEPDLDTAFQGSIDEVMVFTRLLSATELSTMQSYPEYLPSAALRTDDNLIRYYNFEECAFSSDPITVINRAPVTLGSGDLTGAFATFQQYTRWCAEPPQCLTNGPCYQVAHYRAATPVSVHSIPLGAPDGAIGTARAASPRRRVESDFIWNLLPTAPQETAFWYMMGTDMFEENKWQYYFDESIIYEVNIEGNFCYLPYCAFVADQPVLDDSAHNWMAAMANQAQSSYWTTDTVQSDSDSTSNAHGFVLQWGQNDVTWFGNNHKYTVVFDVNQVTWDNARQAALDAGGYLANFVNEAEFFWVVDTLFHSESTIFGGYHPNVDDWAFADGPEAGMVFARGGSCIIDWCVTPDNSQNQNGLAYIDTEGFEWFSTASERAYIIEQRNPSSEKLYGFGINAKPLGSLGATEQFSVLELDIPALDAGDTVTKVVGYGENALLLTSSGVVWGIGDNGFFQLCSYIEDMVQPYWDTITLPDGVTAVDVAMSLHGTAVVGSDGKLYSCGSQDNAELGQVDAPLLPSLTAMQPNSGDPTITTFVKVALGEKGGLAVTADGRVYSWGEQSGFGAGVTQLGYKEQPGLSNIVDVAATSFTFVARSATGEIFTYGQEPGRDGDADIPELVTELPTAAASMFTGFEQMFVIDTAGAAYAWGQNNRGELGTGDDVARTYPERVGDENKFYVAGASAVRGTILVDNTGRWTATGQSVFLGLGTDDYDDYHYSFIQPAMSLPNSISVALVGCGTSFCFLWSHNETSSSCATGHYSSTGQAPCQPCPAGTFAMVEGLTSCTNCSAGTWSSALGATVATECTSCAEGQFSTATGATDISTCQWCAAGKWNDQAGSSSCENCAAGTWSNVTGLTQASDCSSCPAGTYSSALGASTLSACTQCAAGYYSGQVAAQDVSTCTECPQGSYGLLAGAIDVSQCTSCPAGTYSNALAATSLATCSQCVAGTYSTSIGATSNGTCLVCAAGSYGLTTGASTANDCTSCPAGTFSTTQGASAAASCLQCSAGYWSNVTRASSGATCMGCPAGSYGLSPGASALAQCILCAAGTYSDATAASTATTCTQCVAGYFSSNTGATNVSTCLQCPAGSYGLNAGASSSTQCTQCAAGTWSAATAASAATTCTQCVAGYYGTLVGATNISTCLPCSAGSYGLTSGASTSTQCTSCAAGFYSNVTAASSASTCQSCRAGTYSTAVGASSSAACTNCTAGSWSAATAASSASACTSCVAGTYSATSGASSINVCLQCSVGYYSVNIGASSSSLCTACPEGRYGSAPGGSSLSACTPCSAGYYGTSTAAISASNCTQCPAGSYGLNAGASTASQCTLCAAGTYSTAFGASSATVCTPCGTGRYSSALGATVSSTCLSCPAGTYGLLNIATSVSECTNCSVGTYSSNIGASSGTTCSVCTAGTFSLNAGATSASACVSCTRGYYCEGGSSAQACPAGTYGASTAMTAVTQCTSCPAGTYNSISAATASASCLSCPAGYYSTALGASSLSACQLCAIGSYCLNGVSAVCPLGTRGLTQGLNSSSLCTPCAIGTFATTVNSCTACPSGYSTSTTGSVGSSSCKIAPQMVIGVTTATVYENGEPLSFYLSLNTLPVGAVTVAVTAPACTRQVLSATSVSFNASNYNTAQTLRLTAINDNVASGTMTCSIVMTSTSTSDLLYVGVTKSITVTLIDDDKAGLVLANGDLTGSGKDAVMIEGTAGYFTIALLSQPLSDVNLTLSVSVPSRLVASVSNVVLNSSTWNTPQRIGVTAVSNNVADGDTWVVVTLSPVSLDQTYANQSSVSENIFIVDDDGASALSISPPFGNTTEAGATQTIYVTLIKTPTSAVTVTATSSNSAEANVSISTSSLLTVYSSAKIIITGVNDDVADSDVLYSVTVTASGGGVSQSQLFWLYNSNDDVAGIIYSRTSLVVNETGSTDYLSIVPTSQPVVPLTISIDTADHSVATVSTRSVTFSSTTWRNAVNITVTGVKNANSSVPADRTTSLLIAATSGDANYLSLSPNYIPVTDLDIIWPSVRGFSRTLVPLIGVDLQLNGTFASDTSVLINSSWAINSTTSDDNATLSLMTPPLNLASNTYVDMALYSPDGGYLVVYDALFMTDDCPYEGQWGYGLNCSSCPAGAFCPGGYRMWPIAGFWAYSEFDMKVYDCTPPGACAGGRFSDCNTGYEGEKCAECMDDYYRLLADCAQCSSQSTVAILLALQFSFMVVGVLCALFVPDEKLSDVTFVICSLRALWITTGNLENVPSWLAYTLLLLSLLSSDLSFSQPGCAGVSGFTGLFGINVGVVIGTTVLLLGLLFLHFKLRIRIEQWRRKRRNATDDGLDISPEVREQEFQVHAARALFGYIGMVTAILFVKAFSALDCEWSAGVLVLTDEPSTACFSGAHTIVFAVSVIVVLFVVFNVIGTAVASYKAQHGSQVSPIIGGIVVSATDDFKEGRMQFIHAPLLSVVDVLLAVISQFADDTNTAAGLTIAVLVLMIAYLIIFRPFVETWKLVGSLVVYSASILATAANLVPDNISTLLGYLLFALMLVYVGILLMQIFKPLFAPCCTKETPLQTLSGTKPAKPGFVFDTEGDVEEGATGPDLDKLVATERVLSNRHPNFVAWADASGTRSIQLPEMNSARSARSRPNTMRSVSELTSDPGSDIDEDLSDQEGEYEHRLEGANDRTPMMALRAPVDAHLKPLEASPGHKPPVGQYILPSLQQLQRPALIPPVPTGHDLPEYQRDDEYHAELQPPVVKLPTLQAQTHHALPPIAHLRAHSPQPQLDSHLLQVRRGEYGMQVTDDVPILEEETSNVPGPAAPGGRRRAPVMDMKVTDFLNVPVQASLTGKIVHHQSGHTKPAPKSDSDSYTYSDTSI